MSEKRAFRWLHLSDLHVGMTQQGWLWANTKAAFFDDLRMMLKKTGPVDLVFFSGDLAQRASANEYARLNEILSEIWVELESFGPPPALFPVPGNHDVARAKKTSPSGMILKHWWDEQDVRDSFWEEKSEVARFVKQSFRFYSNWQERCPQIDALEQIERGIIAGDMAATFKVRGIKVGLVGLNSAWLQLDAGDYEGKLHIDPRQLMGVTGDDPPAWRERHDLAFLVTHHPISWLEQSSLENWKSEIDPPGRFDAHLFGHMHVSDAQSLAQAGSERRTALQAASIFGLEYFGDKYERIHGYSIGEIELKSNGKVRSIWPRILQRHASGKRRFIPDHTFELDEENRFVEQYSTFTKSTDASASFGLPMKIAPVDAAEAEDLEPIRYKVIGSASHTHVRLPEQEFCAAQLNEKRLSWIQAEWGLGSDGFLWSVIDRLGVTPSTIFRFDFSGFSTSEGFFDEIKRTLDCTFEKFCELISEQGKSCIIFDNVDPLALAKNSVTVEDEVSRIASIVLDYCQNAMIVIRSRGAPSNHAEAVKLRSLDEADTSTYILHSPLGGRQLSQPEKAAKLHRITDGAPSRLDAALKNLQVVGLNDLVSHNTDYGASSLPVTTAPHTLIRAIHELRDSDDPFVLRSYELLITLTIFPQGEQLERIRRFNNAYPFYPPNATTLHERGLIDAIPLSEVVPSHSDSEVRILRVSRAIREFVRSELDASKVRKMDERALEVYFGQNWKSGDISSPVGHKFDDPLQGGYKIANANALLMRLFARAAASGDDEHTKAAFRLLASYFAALQAGNHYRSIAALADDLGEYLNAEGHSREASLIKAQHAKSLRMIGKAERAKIVLEDLDLELLSKDGRQSAMLNLALCYETLDDPRAKETAEAVVRLAKTEPAALQAKAIIIEAEETGPARFSKLKELEEQAKRKKYKSLQNTLALMRSTDPDLGDDQLGSLLQGVLTRARETKDFYNGVRAIVKVCKVKTDRGELLTDTQKSRLIDAYHFLFNERLSVMFDNCHSALWSEFERSQDGENLLRLFRHSSLIWRLRDLDEREQTYAKRLAKQVKPNTRIAAILPRETAYFFARVTAALTGTVKKMPPKRIAKSR